MEKRRKADDFLDMIIFADERYNDTTDWTECDAPFFLLSEEEDRCRLDDC
jgi:hypothetical protein